MRNTMIWLIGVVVATTVPLLVYFYVARERASLVFVLSEPIRLPEATEGTTQAVQQLDVRNVGKSRATDIRIRLRGTGAECKVLPTSKADDYTVHPSADETEIAYPAITPQATLRIIVKSPGEGLSREDVDIAHASGIGRDALAQMQVSAGTVLWFCVGACYVVLGVVLVRSLAIDNLERNAAYRPKSILLRPPPFYIAETKWREIRADAAKSLLRADCSHTQNPTDIGSYWLLDQPKPRVLGDAEWRGLCSTANEHLATQMTQCARGAMSPEARAQILDFPRPAGVPEARWESILGGVGSLYVSARLSTFWTSADLAKELQRPVPDNLRQNERDALLRSLRKRYLAQLQGELLSSRDPVTFVEGADLRGLREEDAQEVRKMAYGCARAMIPDLFQRAAARDFLKQEKPAWMKEGDYDRLRGIAEASSALADQVKQLEALGRLLKGIVDGKDLPESPPTGTDSDTWESVVDLDERVRLAEAANAAKEAELQGIDAEARALKERLTRQLEIINRVLEDPSAIERIEEYDNPFAPGNFRNLQEVARILSEKEE